MSKTNIQHVILFHHFRRILKEAASQKIDIAPLKGTHLIYYVYPYKLDRGMMSDVDFLVKPQKWQAAFEMMLRLGFKPRQSPVDEKQYYEAGFNYCLDDGRHVLFEMHRHLFNTKRFHIDHLKLWSRSTSSDFEGNPCRRLSAEDTFCHIAFHAVVHRLTEYKRTVQDLCFILKDGLDLKLLTCIAKDWQVKNAVWMFLYIINKLHPELKLAHAINELSPEKSVQKAILFLVADNKKNIVSLFNHRIQAAVLWPFLFDNPGLLARFIVNHPLISQSKK